MAALSGTGRFRTVEPCPVPGRARLGVHLRPLGRGDHLARLRQPPRGCPGSALAEHAELGPLARGGLFLAQGLAHARAADWEVPSRLSSAWPPVMDGTRPCACPVPSYCLRSRYRLALPVTRGTAAGRRPPRRLRPR